MMDKDIGIAPTLTMSNGEYKKLGHSQAVAKVLGHANGENWGCFIAKPVYGQESIDATFFKPTHEKRLKNYLSRCMQKYPGIVIQKAIEHFGLSEKSPELRMYFIENRYRYSISFMGNRGAVRLPTSEGGKMKVPMDRLKRVTKTIMKKLPTITMPNGVRLPRLLTRLDMGYIVDGKFQPFVNEVEFVPSLYPEDTPNSLMDKELGIQMVKIARRYVAACP